MSILINLIIIYIASIIDFSFCSSNEDCPLGFYGTNCDKNCDPHCNTEIANCNKEKGICPSCMDKYYSDNKTPKCYECPDSCKDRCTSEGCEACKNKKTYGTWCSNTCEHCEYEETEKDYCNREGDCYGNCEVGFYGNDCTRTCNIHCNITVQNCAKDTGKCSQCYDNYFPPDCDDCPSECEKCISLTKCTKCKERNKWGDICDNECGINCVDDETKESICDITNGTCYKCKDGFYGDKCADNCKDLVCLKCDKENGKCLECPKDYYMKDGMCIKCKDACDQCRETQCIRCKENDRYGTFCEKTCPEQCKFNEEEDRKCNQETGVCEKGCEGNFDGPMCDICKLGYYGANCTNSCEEGCDINIKNCDKTDGGCSTCVVGYYGTKCEYTCAEGCLKCKHDDGTCEICKEGAYPVGKECKKCPGTCEGNCTETGGCEKCKDDKYYSLWCDKECPEKCKDGKCNKQDGTCECEEFFEGETCDHCIFNHTGENCEETCNEGCDISLEEKRNCDKDGKCDCKIKYFDEKCNQECPSNCNFEKGNCDKKTGQCQECMDGFHGAYCNETCSSNCKKCDQIDGKCTVCEDKYFVNADGECETCPNTCKNNKCTINGCDSCTSEDNYGEFCNLTCPIHCLKNETTQTKCDRSTGICSGKCEEQFQGPKCDLCLEGYYGINCTEKCSDGCVKKNCDKETGGCDCLRGFWDVKCDQHCSEHCDYIVDGCAKKDGACTKCNTGYYTKQCIACPDNCDNACEETIGCINCKKGFFDTWCDKNCSFQCKGKKCKQKDGFCDGCEMGYYSQTCNETCRGCEEGCLFLTGECVRHECKKGYFNPIKCNKKCSDQCVDGACDLYTGDCIKCMNNKWGKQCDRVCSNICEDDKRVDCCYAAQTGFSYKSIKIQPKFSFDKNTENTVPKITFLIGSKRIPIEAYIDIDSNSPMVVFDKASLPSNISGTIKTNPQWNSSESSTFHPIDSQEIKGSQFSNIYVEGDYAIENIYLEAVNEESEMIEKEITIHFIRGQNVYVDPKFSIEGEVNAIVGLGFMNVFLDDLIAAGVIEKNIMTYDIQQKTILFGDYSQEIKKNFTKMTTLIPSNPIKFNTPYEIKAKLRGFAYSYRKAYKNEHNITISFSQSNKFIFGSNLQPFFEKIYFGSFFNNGCTLIEKSKDLKEYICEKETFEKNEFQKFGLVIDDFVYYIPKKLLFLKKTDGYHFQIHLKKKSDIVIGKEFLESFPLVINTGNQTLGVFGDTKKMATELMDLPSEWPDSNTSSDWFTPGTIALFIIFGIILLLAIIYFVRICLRKRKTEAVFEDSFMEKKE